MATDTKKTDFDKTTNKGNQQPNRGGFDQQKKPTDQQTDKTKY